MTKNNNPEVRFTGYTEDWKEQELGEVLTERNLLQKISEDAPILAFASGQGVIDRSERKSNNRDHLTHDQENKVYKLTELNDIVYNPSNLKYGAIDRNKHGRGVISPIYVTFTTEQEPSFLELIVKSEKFKLRALQYEEGTVVKRQSVKPEDLLSLKVNISPSKDEQKKIGKLFNKLEKLITLHQNKSDKLINVKKAMLDKMFATEVKYEPEVRFDGFVDKWKKHEIGDVTNDLYNGQTPSRIVDSYWNGEINWLTSGELNKSIVQETKEKITGKGQESAHLRIVPEGTFVLAITGLEAAGTRGNCAIMGIDTTLNQSCMAIYPNPKLLDSNFLLQWYQSKSEEYGLKYTQGSKQQSYNIKILEKLEIILPCTEEQRKIAVFFRQLDKLIHLHKEQLIKLTNIKNACFEQMTSVLSRQTT